MTLSSSTTACHQSGRPQSGRAVSMSGAVPSAPPLGDATGHSPLYVVEPDIPEGMTCANWRRRRQPLPEPGLLAHVGAWQRWHRLRWCRREAGALALLHRTALAEHGYGARAFERAQHGHRVREN